MTRLNVLSYVKTRWPEYSVAIAPVNQDATVIMVAIDANSPGVQVVISGLEEVQNTPLGLAEIIEGRVKTALDELRAKPLQ